MTVTNHLDAIIQANGELSVPGTTTLSHTGTLFASFTGSLTLQYRHVQRLRAAEPSR